MRDNKAAHNKQRKGKVTCHFCEAEGVQPRMVEVRIPVLKQSGAIGQVIRKIVFCSDRCYAMQREILGYNDERLNIDLIIKNHHIDRQLALL